DVLGFSGQDASGRRNEITPLGRLPTFCGDSNVRGRRDKIVGGCFTDVSKNNVPYEAARSGGFYPTRNRRDVRSQLIPCCGELAPRDPAQYASYEKQESGGGSLDSVVVRVDPLPDLEKEGRIFVYGTLLGILSLCGTGLLAWRLGPR